MSTAYLSIGLDLAILAALGATIFYALRLSSALNKFRSYRREFDGLMQDLNKHIEHAYEAVRTMKETSSRSGDDLEYLYKQAQQMGDELKIINETSNNLANRLEGLTTSDRSADSAPDFLSTVEHVQPRAKKKTKKKESFVIQDREFSEDHDDIMDPEAANLQSDAERELYNALKRNKT